MISIGDDSDFKFARIRIAMSIIFIYIALKHGEFLNWASGITDPWSGLATVLIWFSTVIGYITLGIWILVILVLILAALLYLLAAIIELKQRVSDR